MNSISKTSDVVIFGVGKLSEVVTAFLETETDYNIIGYCIENEFIPESENFMNRSVLHYETIESTYPPSDVHLFIAVGNNYTRERIYEESKQKGYQMISHISKSVTKWHDLTIGENVLISGISSLQPFVNVGDNTFIFGSKIGHHTSIGNHVLLSCTTIGGNVSIGDYSFLGLNSAIQHDTIIAEKNIIGMGSHIHHNTKTNEVYTTKDSTVKRSVSADQISSNYL